MNDFFAPQNLEAMSDATESYNDFVEKFKPKKTTDDCYTPEAVYDVVLNYAMQKYGLQGRKVVRPFYPGGDYESFDYDDAVVIDNPPFSILSKIVSFYLSNKIDFFLFAPALTLFSTASGKAKYIVCGADVIYANGAIVCTSFVTNMGENKIEVDGELCAKIEAANRTEKNTRNKVEFPSFVFRAAALQLLAKRGFSMKIKDGIFARSFGGRCIFGGCFLVSDEYANEAEEKRKEAEEKRKEAEKKRKEAEKKRKEAEKKRKVIITSEDLPLLDLRKKLQ